MGARCPCTKWTLISTPRFETQRSGTGVATLLDKGVGRNAPGWRGASVVLVAATLAAWLTVEVVAHWLAMERAQERQAKLQQTADALAYQAMGAGMLGAVSLLGLSEPLLKDMARGTVPPDHPAALARLTVARERFLVNGAYVIARDGTVVAHETAGPRSTGVNLAYRPYFQQAMQGGHQRVRGHWRQYARTRALLRRAPV